MQRMETVAVIDFETTGTSPGQGARATEIAAVLVQDGQIVGRFQSLMNTGTWVPPFIEQLTGISNRMLAQAPPARAVMHELMRFTRGLPLVAHNAAFDRGFWAAETAHAEAEPDPEVKAALLERAEKIAPKEKANATDQVGKQEGGQRERAPGDEGGKTAEAGGGDSPERAAPGKGEEALDLALPNLDEAFLDNQLRAKAKALKDIDPADAKALSETADLAEAYATLCDEWDAVRSDPKANRDTYKATKQALAEMRRNWRAMGQLAGTRTGVVIKNNVED